MKKYFSESETEKSWLVYDQSDYTEFSLKFYGPSIPCLVASTIKTLNHSFKLSAWVDG